MSKRKQRIIRFKDLSRCPRFGSKNTLEKVISILEQGGMDIAVIIV